MVGQIQRNKAKHIAAWADTVHSLSTAKVAAALDRGALQAIEDGLRTDPVDVFVQISLDGDTERGGVDVGDPAAVDAICAQVAGSDGLRLVGLMAIPPLGVDPDAAFAALAAEHRRVLANHPGATRAVGRDVRGPGSRGATRFNVCACRYGAYGKSSSNVSLSSHSSHIFITDTELHAPEGSSDEHSPQGQGLLRYGSDGRLRRRVLRRRRPWRWPRRIRPSR